jgi:hypothetical protein
MKQVFWLTAAFLVAALSGEAASSVTVNKSGTGDFTTIQAAINSGATLITITDSTNYVENLEIGNQDTGGIGVVLTSNKTGTNRPVITPDSTKNYLDTTRNSQGAGFGLFANNSVVSNLIIEAHPTFAVSALMVMAQSVLLENCVFRITSGTTATLGSSLPLVYFGQEGDGSGNRVPGVNPKPGGRDCDGCLVRNCEFIGTAPDSIPLESTGTGFDESSTPNGTLGYLGQRTVGDGTGQGSGYVRMDHVTDGQNITVTFEGCYFHHDRDYGIFPTNRKDGSGSVNVVVKKCRFDAQGKFQVRGRGANIYVESSIFTRCNQIRNGDTENSAVAIQSNDGHVPNGSVSNCVFVNCGSANAQAAYYGGVNNNNAGTMDVNHSTFVYCVSGVDAGSGGSGTLTVSNSIFHQIGNNTIPSVDANGITLTNGSPQLVNGLYDASTNGLSHFNGAAKWSAAFNRFNWNNTALISIGNCMVGAIEAEDTRTWEDALAANEVTGCRLFAGYDTNFVGADTVTRGTPVFVNTDPDAPNAFQLASGSPGQGLGADVGPVLQPRLALSQSGNQLNISWTQPIWMKGVLSSSPSLSPAVWTPVAGVSNNTASVSIGGGNQYFAIIKQ